MEKHLTLQQSRKRRFYLVIPLLILPFLTLAFWALGGGKGEKRANDFTAHKGLILTLPEAQLKGKKEKDKMSLYEEVQRDSLKKKEASSGFFEKLGFINETIADDVTLADKTEKSKDRSSALEQRLNELGRELERNQAASVNSKSKQRTEYQPAINKEEVDRLETLMQYMKDAPEEDPELMELHAILDKIIAIQHPIVKEKQAVTPVSKKDKHVLTVYKPSENSDEPETNLDTWLTDTLRQENNLLVRFWSDEDSMIVDSIDQQNMLVSVEILGDQKARAGTTLKLRLMEPIRLEDKTIPAGTTIYGTTAFMQTRLKIEVTSVLYDGKLFPVNLTAISTDGIEGLPVQSAELHKEAGRFTDDISAQQLLQSGGSLGTELAGAGVQAARSLFSKKIKSISVKLPSGYQLLLKNKG